MTVHLITRCLAIVCCVSLTACGRVELSAGDRARWAPGPPHPAVVPVLVYRGVDSQSFARQMALLRNAGYRTIDLATFARFVSGERVALGPHPFLLTFDDGRLESWTDDILREFGFEAALFVDVGRVAAGDPEHLNWEQLNALQASGRWEVQLQSGSGNHLIRYGPGGADVGSFYAYRGAQEVVGGWRERVFSDFSRGERELAARVQGYRPLAVAPPGGNYGQIGTNDPEIPRLLLARLRSSFQIVFTQDHPPWPSARAAGPIGRLAMTPRDGERDLHALLKAIHSR